MLPSPDQKTFGFTAMPGPFVHPSFKIDTSTMIMVLIIAVNDLPAIRQEKTAPAVFPGGRRVSNAIGRSAATGCQTADQACVYAASRRA
jgi:hypothetical protein